MPSNILRIDSLGDGWCDKDEVMLHASFQLLKDCVEKEALFDGHVDWAATDETVAAKAELLALYEWWKVRSVMVIDEPLETSAYVEDTAMLMRLVNVRWALWT
ncbi:MAG: hypothetical protein V4488_07990 [Pseudomonadota bacterium]